MAKAVETFQSIDKELKAAVAADTAAQRALWREKSQAKREGRKPDPRYARAWVATGDAIDALKKEHGLYVGPRKRDEFYFNPNLAFSATPSNQKPLNSQFEAGFHRPP